MQYTRDQIITLAPDEASAKAGLQLATGSKWVVKAGNSKALWGDCQGSGKTPYKTIVDLTNIAFKCSCPSRKFPCKHGLGLMLLYAQHPGAFAVETEPPPHVTEWLGKREEKAEKPQQKEEKPVDEAGKTKRAEARTKKVNAGIEELRGWIKDVVRAGIMNVPQQAYQFSETITARMVDAQAGGLANQLRQINKINFFKEGWQRQLIKRLSAIYLITEAYKNADRLPADMVTTLQTLIGWTQAKEEVLQRTPVADTWLILSVTTTEEGNITTEKIWLYGSSTARFALVLNFYAGGQGQQQLLMPGMHIKADVVYFPGAAQWRALIKEYQQVETAIALTVLAEDMETVYTLITQQLVQNPFTEQIPFLLGNARLVVTGNAWFLGDENGLGCAVANTDDECWRMLAFSKGMSFTCFCIYENEQIVIHTLLAGDKMCFVR
ncbi:MAG: SWIM zinc finger family protein [Taibaiella sp.]|nr:SWIM zinc finger family protein [Taibaiella sp.]